ncbi:hypothetical protein MXB_3692, partial [Myxobolus squamalis]
EYSDFSDDNESGLGDSISVGNYNKSEDKEVRFILNELSMYNKAFMKLIDIPITSQLKAEPQSRNTPRNLPPLREKYEFNHSWLKPDVIAFLIQHCTQKQITTLEEVKEISNYFNVPSSKILIWLFRQYTFDSRWK